MILFKLKILQKNPLMSSFTNAVLKIQKKGTELLGQVDSIPQKIRLYFNRHLEVSSINNDDVVEVNGELNVKFDN